MLRILSVFEIIFYPSCPCTVIFILFKLLEHYMFNEQIDPQELEHAQWFDRQEVVQMLTHQHKEGLFTPPEQAIAHQLIRAWVTMTANL